jgi:mono/diheme cytochrome c family protein
MSYNQGDYNRGGLQAIGFAMVATVLFFGYVSFFMGVQIDEIKGQKTPGAAVEQVEQKQAAADNVQNFDPNSVKEPWVATAEITAYGKTVYGTNCAMCHGAEGNGDGPAASGLIPPPRNLVEGKWRLGGSQVALYDVLTNGIAGTSMAPWGHLPEVDRWAMVHYIQSITKNKVDKPDELKEFLAKKK